MKRKAFSWLLLIAAAVVCDFCLRYLFGDFQGYLTVSIRGTDYGLAHIKESTAWVSGRHFTQLPGVAALAAIASILALGLAVRFTCRNFIRRKPNNA